MFLDIGRFQVDYVGGDANQGLYKWFKRQQVISIRQSCIGILLRDFVNAYNTIQSDPMFKIAADLVSSNAQEELESWSGAYEHMENEEVWNMYCNQELQLDCLVGIVFSWGHTPLTQAWRQNNLEELFDEETPNLGSSEYHLKVAEYALMLENKFLWLSVQKNGDTDWHSPLFIRLRLHDTKNKRKRTAEAAQRRRDRDARRLEEKRAAKRQGSHARQWPPTPGQSSSSSAPSTQWRPTLRPGSESWSKTWTSSSSSSTWWQSKW